MAGLSCRFRLRDGKFNLTEGSLKTKDDLWFFVIYDKFRVYLSDYGANFHSLVQKPASSLQLNRTLILTKLQKGIEKYVPNVRVKGMDIGYNPAERTEQHMVISYDVVIESKPTVNDVIFI